MAEVKQYTMADIQKLDHRIQEIQARYQRPDLSVLANHIIAGVLEYVREKAGVVVVLDTKHESELSNWVAKAVEEWVS